ncbi:cilia- and flagella-associated protein 221-like isoform X2 [Rhopilema esculentum]|uniref:cilia- and flagella-associated protein 221-like isoform X2 n=1 Tax=Rhopilema esculentum TaxID=499914 RepID=UPI0031D96E30
MAAAKEPALLNSYDLTGLLAPEQERNVPNHLIDTKIFAKLGHNELLHTSPATIEFNGFEVGKVQSKSLRIINASAERQRMHIVPPTSRNFRIKYTKEDTLVPGLHLEVKVLFRGSEYKYYKDCIRIHSKAKENLIVPLYAYPVMNIDAFPDNLHFPPTPIGHRRTKSIPLQCNVQVDFEFRISVIQNHSSFTINPMSGFICGGNKVDIEIAFTPEEYSTAQMQFQVLVSEFNAKPLICSVTGTSIPGLAKEQFQQTIETNPPLMPNTIEGTVDPRALSPLNRSRNRKAERKKPGNQFQNPSTEIIQDGVRFPANLNNPAAVANVLTQKTGKLKAKDLREAVRLQEKSSVTTKQMKEAVFEHLVGRAIAEEERNQMRWCVKLGDDPLSSLGQEKVINDREKAVAEYHIQRGDPQMEQEFNRSVTLVSVSRIHRQALEYANDEPSFDIYANDIWSKRHSTLGKFVQAARKVMVRERVQKRIHGLDGYVSDWRRGKFSVDHARNWNELDEEQQIINRMSTAINPTNVKIFSFPEYKDPKKKDDMAVDALGTVSITTTEVNIETKVRFFDLKVPSQYKVLGYTAQSVPTSIYIPKNLARPLRDSSGEAKSDTFSEKFGDKETSSNVLEDVILEQEDGKSSKIQSTVPDRLGISAFAATNDVTVEEFHLEAPSVLFKEREYPPLHIFNPEPGLLLHAPLLRYTEANDKNRLLPVPTGTDNRSTIKLHKEDVISGAMTWKRLPLQGLVTLNNTPSMSAVYVPRWSDPFNDNLMPLMTPDLLKELPEEDASIEEDDEESEEPTIIPSMDMVHAQFTIPNQTATEGHGTSELLSGRLPTTNNPIGKLGPVPRTTKQKELDKFVQDKKDRLGQRIRINTESLKSYLRLEPNYKDKNA